MSVIGENITCGQSTALEVLVAFIVNDGVTGRGRFCSWKPCSSVMIGPQQPGALNRIDRVPTSARQGAAHSDRVPILEVVAHLVEGVSDDGCTSNEIGVRSRTPSRGAFSKNVSHNLSGDLKNAMKVFCLSEFILLTR